MPTVGVNIPAESFCDAAIGVDNYDGMSKAVRLLKSLGHQRIAFVVDYIPDDMVYSTSQRMEASWKRLNKTVTTMSMPTS